MANTNSELHEKAAALGGVVDADTIDEPFRPLFADLHESANHLMSALRPNMQERWAVRPLHVVFTNSDQVNARATKGADADYIFITLGAIRKVYGTMAGMLSVPDFLPDVGDAHLEETPSDSLAAGFPPWPLLPPNSAQMAVKFCLPVSHPRVTFSMQLASIALHFLLMHEIGHILAGHLEIVEQQRRFPALAEFGSASTRDESTLPQRVLECDADAFAAHVESFVDLHSNMDELWAQVYGWTAVPGREGSFIAHAVALSILFRMMDAVDNEAPKSLDKRYPHPTVRSCLAIGRSFTLGMNQGRFNFEDLQVLSRRSVFQVEETWAALGLPGQRLGEISGWSKQIDRLSKQVLSEYESSKDALVKFSRVPTRWHGCWPRIDNSLESADPS